jgi:hypothetical protein
VNPFHLVVEPPDTSASELPRYANVVHVSSTPYDFRLTFSVLQTPPDGPGDTFPRPRPAPLSRWCCRRRPSTRCSSWCGRSSTGTWSASGHPGRLSNKRPDDAAATAGSVGGDIA